MTARVLDVTGVPCGALQAPPPLQVEARPEPPAPPPVTVSSPADDVTPALAEVLLAIAAELQQPAPSHGVPALTFVQMAKARP